MGHAREDLAGELRRLRDKTGRSLKELEAATHASDSSLSRYLAGQTVPPWSVVEALCQVAGHDPDALRPLWVAAGNARRDPSARVEPGAGEEPAAAAGFAAAPEAPESAAPEPAPPPSAPVPAHRPAAAAAGGASVRRRVIRSALLIAVGVTAGVLATPTWRYVAPSHDNAGTAGPHFSVTLLGRNGAEPSAAIWSMNARCGNADEYRLVYDLPIAVQHRAAAYEVDHADCTVKLFDGIGGSGLGEPLANDHRLHPVPPELVRRGSSLVAYSCCNGRVPSPRR